MATLTENLITLITRLKKPNSSTQNELKCFRFDIIVRKDFSISQWQNFFNLLSNIKVSIRKILSLLGQVWNCLHSRNQDQGPNNSCVFAIIRTNGLIKQCFGIKREISMVMNRWKDQFNNFKMTINKLESYQR